MKVNLGSIFTNTTCICVFALTLHAAELPRVKIENGAGQLVVKGEPFLILGGELGNSSAGTAVEADVIMPKLAAMHVNTVLMPIAWEQIEPKEYRVRCTRLTWRRGRPRSNRVNSCNGDLAVSLLL